MQKAATEIEANKTDQHFPVTDVGGFVEAIEFFELGNLFRVNVATGAITGRVAAVTGARLRHQLFDRAAGHKLNDRKGDGQCAKQRG